MFSIVLPATGEHAWDITEGWVNALQELGLLNRVIRPRAEWGAASPNIDDGLLDYLREEPKDYLILLGIDWHSQPLHQGEIYRLLCERSRMNIGVIWEDYNIKPELLGGLRGIMLQAWNMASKTADTFITNHESNARLLQADDHGITIDYVGFGVDITRLAPIRESYSTKKQLIWFSGKTDAWSESADGGPYALRRSIIRTLEHEFSQIQIQTGVLTTNDYLHSLCSHSICLNLPSFSLSPTLRNYEALAAGSLLVTWQGEDSQASQEIESFPNALLYNPYDLDNIVQACKKALTMPAEEYRLRTTRGSLVANYKISHSARIASIIDILSHKYWRRYTSTEAKPRMPSQVIPLVIDMVFLQVARNGIAYVWDSIIRTYIRIHGAKSIVLLDRSGNLASDYGCTAIKVPPFDWESDPRQAGQQVDNILAEHGISDFVFASTYYTTSEQNKTLQIVHDMIPEILGGTEPVWLHKQYSLERSDLLICISRATHRDLIGYLPMTANKAIVLRNGIPLAHMSETSHQTTSKNECRKIASAKSDFSILYIGGRYGWQGYKNAAVLFKAFKDLLQAVGNSVNMKLVMVSHYPDLEPEAQILARDLPIVHLSASDSELTDIKKACDCIVYPSAIEGFGLPILEGLYAGTGVLASDITPHREAGLGYWNEIRYFPAFDSKGLLKALLECFESRNESLDTAGLRDRQSRLRQLSVKRWEDIVATLHEMTHNDCPTTSKSSTSSETYIQSARLGFEYKRNTLAGQIRESWSDNKEASINI